ncbi:hypothetical protein M5689_021522 [Euphorbia peplus]|nr:hypothetical protein M5689_003361 [Euphorbia peplus]WCJ23733.1 hypothetical protein M5689_005742 [Euphorbia peplus]WCJ25790.1 hypothetical protein M5689_007649 [Euphorbia peplus]WCJ32208.1 hypothetical protein M5689_013648 [Euphorbia peplus]WCJ40610.1 hypothetical protein M5689_021522 [Euphorbia peplus]
MEFPNFAETVRLENCEDPYYCCIRVPEINKQDRIYPSFEFSGRSSTSFDDARNVVARLILEHLLPLHEIEMTDFSSVQIKAFAQKKNMLDAAETVGTERILDLNHKYMQLRDLYDLVVQLLQNMNSILSGAETSPSAANE